MAMASVDVSVDEDVRARAAQILDGLGMTISESVNVFLRQVILKNGIPFEVKYPREEKPNWATRRAMREGDKIAAHPERYKGYDDIDEFFEEMRKW